MLYLMAGIREEKEKRGRDSELKVCTGQGMSINMTIGITRLSENLVRDDVIEERY